MESVWKLQLGLPPRALGQCLGDWGEAGGWAPGWWAGAGGSKHWLALSGSSDEDAQLGWGQMVV